MPTHVLMPALSPEMQFGKLGKWLKREGDRIEAGDILAEIETDMATMEIEAVESGVLQQILVREGAENVLVDTPIALIEATAETDEPRQADAEEAHQNKTFQKEFVHHHTVREALREALAEEMRRDPTVFLLGEEIGDYQGTFRITQGLLREFAGKR